MMPLITVLMPVFNAEKYINIAIDSVLAQTFISFEFLIIDDGSTDKSVEIIQSYTDKRIRLILNNTNEGISVSLNKGVQLSVTDLIARMDADDICYPDRLEKQYQYFLDVEDCALLSTSVREISKEGKPSKINKYTPEFYYFNLTFICWIYHPTVMFKRSVFNDVGGYSVAYSEDFELWWKILRKYRICHLQEILLDYRAYPESLSAGYKKAEYNIYQHQQVIRNIHFYTGKSFVLTYEEVESLRFNFTPLLMKNSTKAIIRLIKKLHIISTRISESENINLNKKAVQEAHFHKRAYILSFFTSRLSIYKAGWLLTGCGFFYEGFNLIIRELVCFKKDKKS